MSSDSRVSALSMATGNGATMRPVIVKSAKAIWSSCGYSPTNGADAISSALADEIELGNSGLATIKIIDDTKRT